MRSNITAIAVLVFIIEFCNTAVSREDIWVNVRCEEVLKPDYCNFTNLATVSVDELDRCAPARLELSARNFFLGAAGRKITYKDNKDAFDRIQIHPKMLRGFRNTRLETSVLGRKMDFPIGLSPVALQKLAHPEGEKATAQGVSGMRTVMILSSLSATLLEEVAEIGGTHQLWMQVYLFLNRTITVELVRRAERSGFKAIVLTVDAPVDAILSCDARNNVRLTDGIRHENIYPSLETYNPTVSFKDISWLRKITNLPIIAKGILNGDDARKAALAGASAIIVSNHGGRELDGALASIDALPGVVQALRGLRQRVEVYMDGGVRSGHDVFKALARGARMVFVGRPQIWGLAYEGSTGVSSVVTYLKNDLNETMYLAGVSKVSDINSDYLLPKEVSKPSLLPIQADANIEIYDEASFESYNNHFYDQVTQ